MIRRLIQRRRTRKVEVPEKYPYPPTTLRAEIDWALAGTVVFKDKDKV